MKTRTHALLILFLLLPFLAACGSDESPPPAPPPPDAATAETVQVEASPEIIELRPQWTPEGALGTAPRRLRIEFPQAVFPSENIGEAAGPGTVLVFDPPIGGMLKHESAQALLFEPAAAAFAPGVNYRVELHSVETKDGLVDPPEGAWTTTLETPPFEMLRFSLVDMEYREGQALAEMVFSGPVRPAELRPRSAFFTVDESGVRRRLRPNMQTTQEPHLVHIQLSNRGLTPGSRLLVELDEGVPSAVVGETFADAAQAEIVFSRDPLMRIVDVFRAESSSGFYIQVICDDQSLTERTGFWESTRSQWYEVSRRCLPNEGDVREVIRFEPEVEFTMTPGRGGFRLFGDFARRTYKLHIAGGLRTVDGGHLPHNWDGSFEIPERSPSVQFVSQGRYLPRDAWKLLPVRHLNVEQAKLSVRHVPPENLVYWMSDAYSEDADERDSNLIAERTLPLRGQIDRSTTSYLDLGTIVPAQTRGLLELTVDARGRQDTARVLLTDLHLVAKRSASGAVDAWALDIDDLRPQHGVDIRLVRKSGYVMAVCRTESTGHCTLKPSEEGVLDPSPPFALTASRSSDLTYLKFDDLEIEVQEARVSGVPYRGGAAYRAALYTDRGVYRPGETAHVAAIVRGEDNVAPAPGLPLRAELLDPRGKAVRSFVLRANAAGQTTFDLEFPAFASTGRYQARLETGGVEVGRTQFQVEEFVPERMKVAVAAEQESYLLSEAPRLEVDARYLFGGVPADHRVEVVCDLEPTDFTPPENENYHYGVWRSGDGPAQGMRLGTSSGVLDAAGAASLACPGGAGFEGPAKLVARAAVFEAGSGRTTVGRADVPVHPAKHYVGLQSSTAKVESGQKVAVEGVIVDWGGRTINSIDEVEIDVVRLETEYGWYWDEASGYWANRRHRRPVTEERRTTAVQNGRFSLTWTPEVDAGAFLIRARAAGASTDLELPGRGDWYWRAPQQSDRTPGPARPTWLALDVPDEGHVGEALTVRFKAPWKGRVLFAAESDELIESNWQTVEAGEVEWRFTPPRFEPNLYISAFLIKDPHLDDAGGVAYLPERAFGVQSVRIEPTELTHPLQIDVPEEVRSRSRLAVDLDLGPLDEPTWATVAAVDQGILSLTGFESPDPFDAIFARRALGVDTFETVGWTLLVPPGGPTSTAAGDKAGELGRVQPVESVALWSGLVEVPESGKARVEFDLPAYRGALRVMAVTAGTRKMGRADAEVIVRDPLVVQSTLPRFLTHEDETVVPVFVTNVSGQGRDVEVEISAESAAVAGFDDHGEAPAPVEILGSARAELSLADGEGAEALFRVRAKQPVGAARFRVTVKSGDLSSTEENLVPLLPLGPRTRKVQRIALDEGEIDLKKYVDGWMPLSERSTFWVTNQPYADVFQHLKYLIRYPYGCLEQTVSSTRPLIYLGELLSSIDPELAAEKNVDKMVQSGIDRLMTMQNPDGGFAYWQGGDEPAYWATAYAAHLLLDAQTEQYEVPGSRLEDALAWMERQIVHHYEAGRAVNDRYSNDGEPYMHYVLALADRPRRARAERLLGELEARPPTGEIKEQIYLLQAALYLAGDHRWAEQLKRPDESELSDRRVDSWSFYSDRRRRGLMLSTMADLFDGKEGGNLANLVAEGLRGRRSGWFSTQELVWGITGLGKYLQGGADFKPPQLTANGAEITPQLSGEGVHPSERTWNLARASEYDDLRLSVPEKGEGGLYLVLSSEGVRKNPEVREGGEGLTVERRYLDGDGRLVDLGASKLGDLVYIELNLRNTSPERISNIALVDRVPAGFEIENPRLGRADAPTWARGKELWAIDHLDLRDDRLEVFGGLERGGEGRVIYAVRAVSAGRFKVPAVEAEAMYDPSLWARASGGVARIAGPWDRKN